MTHDLHLDSETDDTPYASATQPVYPYRCPDLGFHFTPADLMMIKVAGRRAAKFMLTYGQAPQPQLTPAAESAPPPTVE